MPEPKIENVDSTLPQEENIELVSWLDRLKQHLNIIIRQIRGWMTDHTALTPPLYHDNPHPQYWHKTLDPAWASMFFENFTTPKTVLNGNAVTNWDGNVVTDWRIASDTTAGTIVIDAGSVLQEIGYYYVSISGFFTGSQNTSYVLSLYKDGIVTGARMPIVLRGTITDSTASWSGLVYFSTNTTLDVRLEIGASLDITSIIWSIHRISPTAGGIGMGINNNDTNGFPEAGPIPPGWGQSP